MSKLLYSKNLSAEIPPCGRQWVCREYYLFNILAIKITHYKDLGQWYVQFRNMRKA